jgi:hypothetical protein
MPGPVRPGPGNAKGAVSGALAASPWGGLAGDLCLAGSLGKVAEWTGLEPATSGVTGQHSNRLNYHSAVRSLLSALRRTARILAQVGGEKEYLVIGFGKFRYEASYRLSPVGGC